MVIPHTAGYRARFATRESPSKTTFACSEIARSYDRACSPYHVGLVDLGIGRCMMAVCCFWSGSLFQFPVPKFSKFSIYIVCTNCIALYISYLKQYLPQFLLSQHKTTKFSIVFDFQQVCFLFVVVCQTFEIIGQHSNFSSPSPRVTLKKWVQQPGKHIIPFFT